MSIVLACLILAVQAGATRMLSFDEADIPTPKLHDIPMNFGIWSSRGEQSLEKSIVDYLAPDAYILRDYVGPSDASSVNLFVAHFRSLDKTYGPHSPRICLPGSGWLETSGRVTTIQVPGRADRISVNQLTYEKSNNRILVLYWYQNSRRIWAQEFQAKLTLLPDLIKYRRSDVSLVRLIVPAVNSPEDLANCTAFAKAVFPALVERIGPVQ
ncbi:MAG TPA: EpsI family protein [Bryobacteraceae bacterium]|nr:EpsI family protein [Bryobacteraceae bacterium]